MGARIYRHFRSNVVGYVAVFIALSGTAYAVDGPLPGQNQVGSEDIINGEVKNAELGTDAVASGKIQDGQVKNADLSIGASSSNTIADGGILGLDIHNDTLTGAQVNESSLGKVPNAANADNADTLDGKNSTDFLGRSEAPHSPTLESCDGVDNWAPAAIGLDPHYWKDAAGIVHLEGAVTCPGAATGGPIFQMPATYRPAQDVVRYGMLGNGLSLAQLAVVNNTFTAGVVYDGGTSADTDDYVSLDGITYRNG
jgi:hypothetical protein